MSRTVDSLLCETDISNSIDKQFYWYRKKNITVGAASNINIVASVLPFNLSLRRSETG
jgi:hypothetical protein